MVNQLGPWTITFEQETVPSENGPEPDRSWRFIDRAGHGHFWKDGYPTLKPVIEECYCSVVDEPHSVEHWECPHCGETITPRITPSRPTTVLGRLRVTLEYASHNERRTYDGFTEQEAQAIRKDPIEAIPRLTANRQPSLMEFMG